MEKYSNTFRWNTLDIASCTDNFSYMWILNFGLSKVMNTLWKWDHTESTNHQYAGKYILCTNIYTITIWRKTPYIGSTNYCIIRIYLTKLSITYWINEKKTNYRCIIMVSSVYKFSIKKKKEIFIKIKPCTWYNIIELHHVVLFWFGCQKFGKNFYIHRFFCIVIHGVTVSDHI